MIVETLLGEVRLRETARDDSATHLLYQDVVLEDLASLHDADDGGLEVHLAVLIHSHVGVLHLLRGQRAGSKVMTEQQVQMEGAATVIITPGQKVIELAIIINCND